MAVHEIAHRIGRLLRNFLVLGAGNYGAMAVALAINAVLTRRLGVEQFGRLALLLTTSQVIALVVANWTQIAIVRFGAREFSADGSVAETFWTRIWIVAPWALAAAGVMLGARHPVASYLTIPPWGLAIVMAHFLAALVLSTVGSIFQAKDEMHRYGTVLFLDKAVMVVLLLALPSAWVREPLLVLALYAASSLAVAIWGLASLGLRSLTPVVFNRHAYRRMLAFSLPLILSSWAGLFGTSWFDLLVMRRYRPLSDLGLYSLGTVLAGVVQQVTVIFSTLLLPQFSVMVARGEHDKIRTLVERLLPYWLLATSVLFSLVLLGADTVIPLIFGRAFQQSARVVALLMLATCALGLFNAFSPLVSAFGSTWALTLICLASGAVNVAMDLALIPRYGITGAAVATVLAYGTSAALILGVVHARLHGGVFSLGLLGLPVVVVCACYLLLDGARFYLFAIPAAVATVCWLVRRFRLFRAEDAAFLRLATYAGEVA